MGCHARPRASGVRIGFFGAWDAGYPRNRILRAGLVAAGAEVVDLRVRERRVVFRYPRLVVEYARAPRLDALFVPAFRHKDMPLARWLAGRVPVVFDPLVSRWDTLVEDWAIHATDSLQAKWNRSIDRWALRGAQAVLCDTWAHGRLFAELGARPESLHRIPVGAEQRFFDLADPDDSAIVEVLYVGGFLPLHGVPTLIDALAELQREDSGIPEYRVRLVGRGIQVDVARQQAERRALRHVVFEGPRPYAELPAVMASAHIVLGAFGASAKAGRVVPHKVWQGLAAGRAVLSGDGDGVREWFRDGVELLSVPRDDSHALAAALGRLIRDAGLRRELGNAGRARAREIGTPAQLGRELFEVFEAVVRAS